MLAEPVALEQRPDQWYAQKANWRAGSTWSYYHIPSPSRTDTNNSVPSIFLKRDARLLPLVDHLPIAATSCRSRVASAWGQNIQPVDTLFDRLYLGDGIERDFGRLRVA